MTTDQQQGGGSPQLQLSLGSGRAIKRLSLTNFKVRESLDEDESVRLQALLMRATKQILQGDLVTMSFEELYKTVDLMCRYGQGRGSTRCCTVSVRCTARPY